MNEVQSCQQCGKSFKIPSEDASFYEKIHVPAPTFCFECRLIRRFSWRNVRSLYRRTCGLCNTVLISMYDDDGVPVYCNECFNGDAWDQYAFAKDIDWNKPFFAQWNELLQKVPRHYQYRIGTLVNSDYSNYTVSNKNVYLAFSAIECEDVLYSEGIDTSRNCIDCFGVRNLDQCAWNIDSEGNYNSHFMLQSQSCIDSFFLYDCANCQNCCMSTNLRNQQYVFKNQKLSKEAYKEAIAALGLGSESGFDRARDEFFNIMKASIHRFAQTIACQDVTGDFLTNSRSIVASFDVQDAENVRYSTRVLHSKDIIDCQGVLSGELEYETLAGSQSSNIFFSIICIGCNEMEYSGFCKSSSNCFGCIGLKNAHYCIFNKQYTKEEYAALVPKLRQQMLDVPYTDAKGSVYRFGEFFPSELSLFGYNETVAHDYFPISESEAREKGFKWKEREKRTYATTKRSAELPDDIKDVDDSILNETIECPHGGDYMYRCTNAYKITANELAFYRQKNLPLPRYCPNCRHALRLSYRNQMRLYSRTCTCLEMNHGHEQVCPNHFETSYAPNRPEKIYCESCYQKAVL